jgi:exopolysaccharide biosynthesis polyprenyl glycosylphosphotransferase
MLGYAPSVFLYTALLKVADAATALGVWYLCWYLRFHTSWFPVTKGLPELSNYDRVAVPLVVVLSLMLHVVGAYRRDRIHFGFRALKKVIEASILGTLVFVATCYFLGERDYSRLFLGLYAGLLAVCLCLERGVFHLLWRRWLSRGTRKIRVLLVGSGDLLRMYVDKIRRREPYPVDWVGHVELGQEARLAEMLADTHPDQVVVSYPERANAEYARILEILSEELVDVKVLPDFGRYSTFTYVARDELGIPLLAFNQISVGNTDRAMKRMLDIVGAMFFLVVASPLYAALAIAIKATSRGPVFFSQERVGADGARFRIYKFRTMRTDAEAITGPVWAVENDPRTTSLGKWLRRTSLDEIPQFWNVLKGDMSLVGPRPERPEFVAQFRREIPKYMLRHKMKSGITGWAQINGWRGNTSLNERIKHDLYYIGHWSHLFDVKILCLTLIRGFVHRHAY